MNRTSPPIAFFTGPNRFLSNFYPSPIVVPRYDMLLPFPAVEHAYQAAKCYSAADRLRYTRPDVTAAQAKAWGRHEALPPTWEAMKENIMFEAVWLKFSKHVDLRERLLATGDAQLIEGNTWGDRYWGVCRGEGKNRLGEILMSVRHHLGGSQ